MKSFRDLTPEEFGEELKGLADRLEFFYREAARLETMAAWIEATDAGTDALVADIATLANGGLPATQFIFMVLHRLVSLKLAAEGIEIPEWSEVTQGDWEIEKQRLHERTPFTDLWEV